MEMAYTTHNFKTKKELKEAIATGRDVRAYNPGLGIDLGNYTGRIALEGPHYPKPHSWYAEAEMKEGKVIKVR